MKKENNLLKIIKENDKNFKRFYCLQSIMDVESQEEIKSYIAQSRIKELKELVDTIKEIPYPGYHSDIIEYVHKGYYDCHMNIIYVLEKTIKKLKNGK